jgi:hypothetical protein
MSLLLASVVLAAMPPAYPVSDIKPGQRGECVTVFEGDTPEPMAFVVKGVMRNFLGPDKHIVVIKLVGEKPEFTGVVAGMSGSPCAIDGKLVGALAYAFSTFAKEPIAGVTPIGDMIEVLKQPETDRPWRLAAADPDWRAFKLGQAPERSQRTDGVVPIATPLSMSGVPSPVWRHFEPWLRAMGFEPVAGGASAVGAMPQPIVPGSALAAVLVRGDVDVAATGTVTAVDGDRLLAFGHPFLGVGLVSMPMANATIVNTMVSAQRSFKMSVTGAVIGEVIQDRLTALGGRLGAKTQMVPVTGRVRTSQGESRFALEVARDQMLTPRFVAMGAASALAGRVESSDRGTVRLSGVVDVEGLEPIRVENVYSAERDGGLFVNAAIEVAQTFGILWETPFGPPPKMSVALDASFEPVPAIEWIEAIRVDRGELRPGRSAEVVVELRRAQGGTSRERFLLQVPRSWAGEQVELVAAGVSAAEELAEEVAGGPRPTDLKQVGKWLRERRVDGQLYLLAVRPGSGLQAGVEVMPFLPGSAIATLSGATAIQRRNRGLAWEERRARPGTIFGKARTSLKVRAD